MKYILYFLCIACLFSCALDGNNKTLFYSSVSIQNVYTDSVSIRAISPVNDSMVWFAGSGGKVGLISGKTPKLATIRYEDSLLSFRAIAQIKDAVFVLSIANPGVLYRIGFNGEEATYIEDVYTEKGDAVFYDAMKFWDDTEGIAMGDPTDDCISILITRDGGNTWTKISCNDLPKVENGEAAFAASNSNISVYKNNVWIVTGGKKARVFYSGDRGVNWEVFETPIIQGEAMTGIYSVDFFNEKLGVIFGGNWENKDMNTSNKAITTDGGKTWKLVSDGVGPGYRSSVKFIPGSNGKALVAVGSPGISYSYDFGESWQELSKEGFYAIEFVNDSIAFASGRNKIVKLLFQ